MERVIRHIEEKSPRCRALHALTMEPLHEDAFALAENSTRDHMRALSKRGLGRSHADNRQCACRALWSCRLTLFASRNI
eukprot:16431368-Heterocapsa_arctica.AAC.1